MLIIFSQLHSLQPRQKRQGNSSPITIVSRLQPGKTLSYNNVIQAIDRKDSRQICHICLLQNQICSFTELFSVWLAWYPHLSRPASHSSRSQPVRLLRLLSLAPGYCCTSRVHSVEVFDSLRIPRPQQSHMVSQWRFPSVKKDSNFQLRTEQDE